MKPIRIDIYDTDGKLYTAFEFEPSSKEARKEILDGILSAINGFIVDSGEFETGEE